MKMQLISQPFEGGTTLYAAFLNWLSDPRITRLDIAVAWAKRSGLRLVRDQIESFKARGGELHLTIGIDAGGATAQGLELAHSLATTCAIFHHPSSRTFHPKLYLATGLDCAQAIIGSQNLTRGGLFENFEVGVRLDFEMDNESDVLQLEQIRELIEQYRNSGDCLIELDIDALNELLNNPRYNIQNEDHFPNGTDLSYSEGNSTNPSQAMFGHGTLRLVSAPSSSESKTRKGGATAGQAPNQSAAVAVAVEHPSQATVEARWSKVLSAADAQWPEGSNTNPTGHLTLVQAGHPIAHASWFREHFFGGEKWEPAKSGKEIASVVFDLRNL